MIKYLIVVLVRDPRGVYSSRSKGDPAAWCTSPECASPKVGCNDLLLDVQVGVPDSGEMAQNVAQARLFKKFGKKERKKSILYENLKTL